MKKQSGVGVLFSVKVLLLLLSGMILMPGAISESLAIAKHANTLDVTHPRWFTTEVDTGEDVGQHTSLSIDPTFGIPYVSYYDTTNKDLKVAWYVGTGGNCDANSAWRCRTVDSEGDVGQFSSIAVSANGVIVVYHDASNGDLKCAKKTSSWSVQTIESEGNTGLSTSLLLDSLDRVNICYFDSSDSEIQFYDESGMSLRGSFMHADGVDLSGHRQGPAICLLAAPNPFAKEIHLSTVLPGCPPFTVRMVVLDAAGREIHRVWDGPIHSNRLALDWDGTDQDGIRLPQGPYFLSLRARDLRGADYMHAFKLILLE